MDGTGFRYGPKAMTGISYAYVSNGAITESNALGSGWGVAKRLPIAIGAATGIGLHSATTVPLLLLQTQYFKMGGISDSDNAVLLPKSQTIAGHSCYEVTVSTPYKITYYVDKKTWLLVRSVEDLSGMTAALGGSGTLLITLNMKDPIVNKPIPSSAFALSKVTTNSSILNPH